VLGKSELAFSTYTEFFGHVDNICFYAQHSVFQLSTQSAVNQLYTATVDSAIHLQRFTSSASSISERILSVLQTGHSQLSASIDDIREQEHQRFAALSKATDSIQSQQATLLETVQNGTQQLSHAVNDSLELQVHLPLSSYQPFAIVNSPLCVDILYDL
jgi:DNA anti-recombination protein RmuC